MENPEATEGGGWLRPSEAAELFGVHRVTLARWAKAGKLGVQLTAGSHRRYREADARALLATLQSAALPRNGATRRGGPTPRRA